MISIHSTYQNNHDNNYIDWYWIENLSKKASFALNERMTSFIHTCPLAYNALQYITIHQEQFWCSKTQYRCSSSVSEADRVDTAHKLGHSLSSGTSTRNLVSLILRSKLDWRRRSIPVDCAILFPSTVNSPTLQDKRRWEWNYEAIICRRIMCLHQIWLKAWGHWDEFLWP